MQILTVHVGTQDCYFVEVLCLRKWELKHFKDFYDHFSSGIFFVESCYKNNNELSYVAKVSGKIYLTALIFYDALQTIEQSFVVALVTFSLLPGPSRNNRNIYLTSFFLQLTCLASSSSSSVKTEDNSNCRIPCHANKLLRSRLRGTQLVIYAREEVVLVAGYAVRGTQYAVRSEWYMQGKKLSQ